MSSHNRIGKTGSALSVLQIALIVAPSFILFGYNQAGIGGLLTLADWVKTFPEIDTVNATGAEKSRKSTVQGAVVAVFVIGALFGSLSCSYTGNAFGRRKVILLGPCFPTTLPPPPATSWY
jgi:MFS family permease